MASEGGSFFPRIQSVFYAVFDVEKGPKINYQVPEGLIGVTASAGPSGTASFSSTPFPSDADLSSASSRSTSLISSTNRPSSRSVRSPLKSPIDLNQVLFNFDEISNYVIPRSPLCGRLVVCATRNHRIIGFPMELKGDYPRNYFRYNLCFVFERSADLSCYEPIVRKVSRVLSCCEEESRFLSSASTSPEVHAILEQLYEDLNSYSETQIAIDQFNSIELKIFPFYPNPPPVKDWMVPLALINLTRRIKPNWDLTMVKVCQFIDGTNHVSKIAHLADCDLDLTRQAISHLLYYQVIMTIDIFQYSNMYTLTKGIQWLADEPHVINECGLYVKKPGRTIPDWPQLLHLYSRLKPGITVKEWMDAYEVHKLGVDVRRFTSFGVIKGFLRRVHRWPVLLPQHRTDTQPTEHAPARSRGDSFNASLPPTTPIDLLGIQKAFRGRPPRMGPLATALDTSLSSTFGPKDVVPPAQPLQRASAAELRSVQSRPGSIQKTASFGARPSWVGHDHEEPLDRPDSRRPSLASTLASLSTYNLQSSGKPSNPPTPYGSRPRISPSPSLSTLVQGQMNTYEIMYPPELLPLLDGEHHTDELATRFEVGWPTLERWLISAGDGKGNGDFGRVSIIYR